MLNNVKQYRYTILTFDIEAIMNVKTRQTDRESISCSAIAQY